MLNHPPAVFSNNRWQTEWIGFLTLFHKEVARFVRVAAQTLFSPLINALLYLIVFGLSFSALLKTQQGFTYLEFLIPGLAAMAALNNSLQNSSSSVMVSKFHGDLQDIRLIPLSSTAIAAAYTLASIFRGVIVGMLVLILGEFVFYFKTGNSIQILHPGELFVFLILGGAIFGNLGTWTGFICKTFDQIHAVTNFVVLPLIYLGGVFFSIKIFHPVVQQISAFNPLLYLINGIRWSILGVSDIPIGFCLSLSLVFVAISCVIAWYSVRFGSYQRF